MLVPPSLAWRSCACLERERACLRIRISPAMRRERKIRKCDVCPVGTERARALARNAQRAEAALYEDLFYAPCMAG